MFVYPYMVPLFQYACETLQLSIITGVTFLIAYVVMLLISGLPLFFLELALGQYAGKGPLKLFGRMTPGLKGLGYGMLIISFLVVIYYNMIIAWTLFYTFAGFASELPWQFCGTGNLTSQNCFQRDQEMACFNQSDSLTYWDKQCTEVEQLCSSFNMTLGERDEDNRLMCNNGTQDQLLNKVYRRVSPSEDYFKRTMLGLEDDTSWENMGGLKWELVLCLFAAWTIVCLCLIKGVQSSGKVVYFTALFPYLVLVILLIRGATLDGAYDGIIFYVYPTQEKLEGLQDIAVWSAAATQIFYSLGPSFGGLITLASYNKFNNNCHRDAILIAFANCGTSIFAGFVIFSIIGFMAKQAGQSVEDVITGGTGLAFIAYPEAVTQMPVPQLWSFLFFGMLITLGLDSQFTMTETLTTAVMDQYPQLRAHKGKVVIGASVIGFLLGLTMCSKGGLFMFELINWYSASQGLLICAIIEILAVMYGFGFRNFIDAIKEMEIRLPIFMKYYWLSMWMVVTPVCLFFVLIMTFVQYSPAWAPHVAMEKYYFPNGIQAMGWMMALVPVAAIILGAVYQVWNRQKNHKSTSFKAMLSPNEKWGPATITNAVKKTSNDNYNGNINEGFNYNSKYNVETNHL
jgi:solute carrier family 6 amino acid transporter-like protein 5/7/9/14